MPRRLVALLSGLTLLGAAPAAAHADTYPDHVVRGSVYYWRLGEPGTFSPDRNLGVGTTALYGTQVTPQEPGALSRDDNGAVRLLGAVPDGVWQSSLKVDADAYVAAPGRRPLGWEIWIKPASLDANTRRIVSVETTRGGYLIGANDHALVFSRYKLGPDSWSTISVPAPPIGAWTHVAATYDGTQMTLYVNGRPVGSRTSAFDLPAWSETDVARLGAHSRSWLEWDGWLDEASFYRDLTPDAVAQHYALGTA